VFRLTSIVDPQHAQQAALAGSLAGVELLVVAPIGAATAVHVDALQNNFPTLSNVSTPSTAKIAAAML
jgi:hypothetical protein